METAELASIGSFEELVRVVLRHLATRSNLGEVIGPIGTGGVGNKADNLKIFAACIQGLQARGEDIFDQMPYEECMWGLIVEWREQNNSTEYCNPILDIFYTGLFEAGKITKGFSILTSKRTGSKGQKWEEEKLAALGIPVDILSDDEVYGFIRDCYPTDEAERLIKLMQEKLPRPNEDQDAYA